MVIIARVHLFGGVLMRILMSRRGFDTYQSLKMCDNCPVVFGVGNIEFIRKVSTIDREFC